MNKILVLILGGSIGTLTRYGLGLFIQKFFNDSFPYGTLTVNLIGSLLIGLFWGLFNINTISSNLQLFLFIGVLGSFTTFSSFSLDTLNLFKEGHVKMALLNILVHNFLGLLLVFLGYVASKGLLNFLDRF